MSLRLIQLLSCAVAAAAPALAQHGASTAGRNLTNRYAELGQLPDPSAIIVRDIVNYHRHQIPLPVAGSEVAMDLRWDTPLPAHTGQAVLQIGLSTGRVHDTRSLRPLHLALVIDRSSSMAADRKMSCVKAGLRRFVQKLRKHDQVTLVGYATDASTLLPLQPVGDGIALRQAIDTLTPGGNTNLHAGLMLGYDQLTHCEDPEVDRRVILLTDGLANRGIVDAKQIAKASKQRNRTGIDLSTIGVGNNVNQQLLQQLARSGRGLFHFVSDQKGIHKVFVEEAQGLLGIVARDVELEIQHGQGLEIVRVFGYRPARRGNRLTIRLESFNAGLTSVVMVQVRRAPGMQRGSALQARLRYRRARDNKLGTIHKTSRFLDPDRSGAETTDHEVRKNFTIAVLANATRRLAQEAKASRPAKAERIANRALGFYKRHYHRTDDKDLLHSAKILRRYRSIVSHCIERFRDELR